MVALMTVLAVVVISAIEAVNVNNKISLGK
jgi:hypothetical protein